MTGSKLLIIIYYYYFLFCFLCLRRLLFFLFCILAKFATASFGKSGALGFGDASSVGGVLNGGGGSLVGAIYTPNSLAVRGSSLGCV